MNVYECNGIEYCMRWKIGCSIQQGVAELNRTSNLSPHAIFYPIVRMRNIHYLFYTTPTVKTMPLLLVCLGWLGLAGSNGMAAAHVMGGVAGA